MKKILTLCAAVFSAAILFAYNPPAGGQSLYNLSSPTQLTSASSAAGGGIFMPGPDSIAFNPALPSYEDRIQLDFGVSGLINTGDGDSGAAFQTGILVPTKMFNISGMLNGVYSKAYNMYLGNSMNFKAGLSKQVTESICIGVNLDAGYLWGCDEGDEKETDWSIGGGLGAMYRRETFGFARDFRIGASVLNLGKYYDAFVPGIKDGLADSYPAFATLRTGAAANLVNTDNFVLGASFDVTYPAFQNFIFDAGVNFAIMDKFFINIAEQIDIAECSNGSENFLPAIGFGFKFNFNSNNSYTKAHNWEKNEMLASLAWQQRYEKVQVISGGMRVKLGQEDEDAPVIELWDEE